MMITCRARQTYVDAMKKEKEGDGRAHYKYVAF